MYRVEDLSLMEDDERRAILDELAKIYFGTARWKTQFARSTGLSGPASVQQWYSDRSSPPVWSILLLQSWIAEGAAAKSLKQVKDAMTPILERL